MNKFIVHGRASIETLKKNNASTEAIVRCIYDSLRHAMVFDTDFLHLTMTKCKHPNTMTFQLEFGGKNRLGLLDKDGTNVYAKRLFEQLHHYSSSRLSFEHYQQRYPSKNTTYLDLSIFPGKCRNTLSTEDAKSVNLSPSNQCAAHSHFGESPFTVYTRKENAIEPKDALSVYNHILVTPP